ncbi:HAD family hydrolase [Coraliomargarita parva]|uniref:HAD family hydrolase n=1 Tax=Coraliomargarita parva TaxID=3014050 RepID=UPI0022B5A258|nr:HAD family hydrolase [Coraliomargarita parva]
MPTVPTIIFDADDTLWHNMNLFADTHERFTRLLSAYFSDAAELVERLEATERRNIEHFGYGVKGFTLSMIETAVEVTGGRVGGEEIKRIIGFGKEMLGAPVQLLPGVQETVEALAGRYPLAVITKGDLLNQEAKVARSGLASHFDFVEVVSEKDADSYARLFERHGVEAASVVMVGNSMKSDIEPVLTLGGKAVHIPYAITWVHELKAVSEELTESGRFRRLEAMHELPTLLLDW